MVTNSETADAVGSADAGESSKDEFTELVASVNGDINDTSEWRIGQGRWKTIRLKQEKPKTEPYPGASSVVEGIVDENVDSRTQQEMAILWQTRNLAQFKPVSDMDISLAARAQDLFDCLVREKLDIRGKLNGILNHKNERGLGFAKLVSKNVDGAIVPYVEVVDPIDLVIPVSCKANDIQSASRICHIIKLSKREFFDMAAQRRWNNAESVWETSKANLDKTMDDKAGSVPRNSSTASDIIILWEIYHWMEKEEAGKEPEFKRWISVVSENCPDQFLEHRPWAFMPIPSVSSVETFDPQSQRTVLVQKTVDLPDPEDRPWPFVVFRFEEISEWIHESRGLAEILESYQKEVSNFKNARNGAIERMCKPYVSGNPESARNFRFRAGECIPKDVSLVFPGAGSGVENLFALPSDQARALASRRAGSGMGSLSSTIPGGGDTKKTAREVSTMFSLSMASSQNGIESAAEPLGKLFRMMWQWIVKFSPGLVGPQIASGRYTILCGASGKLGNPDFVLGILGEAGPWMEIIRPFVRGDAMAKLIFDLISPAVSDRVVVDPSKGGGPSGAPIEQQVQQLAMAVQKIAQAIQMMSGPPQGQPQDMPPGQFGGKIGSPQLGQ